MSLMEAIKKITLIQDIKVVSKVYYGCPKGIPRALQRCLRVLQGCFTDVSLKDDSSVFQEDFNVF